MAFNTVESNGRLGCTQCWRSKESRNRGKSKRGVYLFRRTVRVKVQSKAIKASFLKIEGKWAFVGRRPEKEGWLVELINDQNPDPEVPSRSKREASKGNVREEMAAVGATDKSRRVSVIEGVAFHSIYCSIFPWIQASVHMNFNVIQPK